MFLSAAGLQSKTEAEEQGIFKQEEHTTLPSKTGRRRSFLYKRCSRALSGQL